MKKLKLFISLIILIILVFLFLLKGIWVMNDKYDVTRNDIPWWYEYNNFSMKVSREDIKRSVIVAVVDTGVSNENFPYSNIIAGYNAIDGSTNTKDTHGHGKVLAHLIASPQIGINPYANILPVKVRKSMLDKPEIVSEGIIWAVNQGVDIINLSIGKEPINNKSYEGYREGVEYALKEGKLLIASAGTNGNKLFYPAAFEGVISVAGLDRNLNYRSNIDVEDIDIFAVDTNDKVSSSFPTAIVSGAVSLIMALDEDLSPQEAMRIILKKADTIYINGKSAKLLNLDRAIEFIKSTV
ncbi:peptidase S8 and S53, subtilisin, kexin, sedolisin [Alkaliphilus metalliredigens QYMF]|uniref:Peptidase S8 and S53, subtilisin, kexin, sedolisin n=1 Tax=Alkaliphilus metalliredigens (strain QYMF) TaxID=293826 RepID=A6TQ13_ALKMQ|nr:S8 family serine peptidase [Alkaliphilus metalliredigens]ABR48281.1 peptidase S8 and S53, subtilisin, kexin, sedolisin [Alkaliphilus metalliredigens QYMF]